MISKSDIIKTLGFFGLYPIARFLTRRVPIIVMYHRFSETPEPGKVCKAVFEKQVQYIVKHFNAQPLSVITSQKGKEFTPNTIVVTVDDGHEDFYRVAYPILKKYKVPCTLFVTTKFVAGGFWLWPDKITWLLTQTPTIYNSITLGQNTLPKGLITQEKKGRAWELIVGYLLTLNDQDKHEWITQFSTDIGIMLPNKPPKEFRAVSWDQLKDMQGNGISIGGHTVTHPSLGRVDSIQLAYEVEHCKKMIDDKLGKVSRDFCYPNGQPQDYNDDVKEAVQNSGFRSSVVAFYDKKSVDDIWALRRHTVSEDWFQFHKSVNGVETLGSQYMGYHNRLSWKD